MQYVVRPGDRLGDIAQYYDTTVAELLRANPQITDPNLIYPGQILELPGTEDTGAGTTSTLWGIPGGRIVPATGCFHCWRPNFLYQKLHMGEDVTDWPTGTPIYNLARAEVYRVRDHGAVSGYNQEITLYYPDDEWPVYVLFGHVGAGVSELHAVGDTIEREEIVAYSGTVADSMNDVYRHTHVQVWDTEMGVANYANASALDPRPWREWFGDW